MRIIPDYISQSITVSVKTEAMLIQIKDKFYFVEYKTNLLPKPENLKERGNIVSEVNQDQFSTLKKCFEHYIMLKMKKPWLHAPSFVHGYCVDQGLELDTLGILI